jgi:hypothetical protein
VRSVLNSAATAPKEIQGNDPPRATYQLLKLAKRPLIIAHGTAVTAAMSINQVETPGSVTPRTRRAPTE